MTDTLSISGRLNQKDVRRLTRITRGGAVGPTALYYAGVTAPIISASIAMVVREALHKIDASDYWTFLLSSLVAAFAGITWYLIFVRWSYRHKLGRGTEMTLDTHVSVDETGIQVKRGEIVTRIGWPAVKNVNVTRHHTSVEVEGADALIVPNEWFNGDKTARKAFQNRLIALSPD